MSTTAPRRGLALGILIFASFMDLLDVTIVQIALPRIRTDLDATAAQLEWTVSGYMLAFAVLLITGGRLGDIVGRKRMFLLGVAGFTLASAGGALAPDADLLVVARCVQGAFAAAMVPQLLSTLQALYTPRERAPLYGVVGGVAGLAAVAGPLLGGWLITADPVGIGWRGILLINVPVGIVLLVAAAVAVPETRSAHPLRLDPLGVVLLTVGLLGLVVPLVEGQSLDWPGWLVRPAVGGALTLVAFVAQQRSRARRSASPLLPLALFRNRGFSAGIVTQAAFQGAMNAFTVVFLVYLQTVLRFSALGAGLTLLAFSVGALLGTGVAVPLGTRIGKPVIVFGALLQAGGIPWSLAVLRSRGADLSGWDLVLPLAVMGVGLSLVVIPLVDIALANVPVEDAGAASGAYSTFQQLGAALGVAISGTVFFGHIGTDFRPGTVLDALTLSGIVAAAGYLLSAVAALLLPRRADVLRHAEEQAALLAEEPDPKPTPVA